VRGVERENGNWEQMLASPSDGVILSFNCSLQISIIIFTYTRTLARALIVCDHIVFMTENIIDIIYGAR